MSQPFAERLSRFTPDTAGLDREALLFAAGRASARADRRWIGVAAALAVSQLLTLAILWHRPTPSTPAEEVRLPQIALPAPSAQDLAPDLSEPRGAGRYALELDVDSHPSPVVETLAPSEPSLRAFDAPPSMLLN
jgi:hypothetical protein